jgi:hypothetical protein
MTEAPQRFGDADALAQAVVREVGTTSVLALPLGLGKQTMLPTRSLRALSPTVRSPIELMPQCQEFGFQPPPRLEAVAQHVNYCYASGSLTCVECDEMIKLAGVFLLCGALTCGMSGGRPRSFIRQCVILMQLKDSRVPTNTTPAAVASGVMIPARAGWSTAAQRRRKEESSSPRQAPKCSVRTVA